MRSATVPCAASTRVARIWIVPDPARNSRTSPVTIAGPGFRSGPVTSYEAETPGGRSIQRSPSFSTSPFTCTTARCGLGPVLLNEVSNLFQSNAILRRQLQIEGTFLCVDLSGLDTAYSLHALAQRLCATRATSPAKPDLHRSKLRCTGQSRKNKRQEDSRHGCSLSAGAGSWGSSAAAHRAVPLRVALPSVVGW